METLRPYFLLFVKVKERKKQKERDRLDCKAKQEGRRANVFLLQCRHPLRTTPSIDIFRPYFLLGNGRAGELRAASIC